MAKLLYSASRADGSRTEGFVDAESAAAARAALATRGLNDITLHQEPMFAQDPAELEGLTPAQQRELARLKVEITRGAGLRAVLVAAARLWKWWLVGAAAAMGYGAWSGSSGWMLAGAVSLMLPFAFVAWGWRHGARYLRLVRAFSIGDWPRVRRLAEQLRPVFKRKAEMDFDLDIRLACADAREGRLDEALRRIELAPSRAALAPGVYEGRVATVYAAAGDFEGFVSGMEGALSHNPGDPSRMLDAALAHARYGDAARAEALLAGVDTSLLPPHGLGFVHWARGRLQLARGQAEAVATLHEAVAAFVGLAQQPAVWTALAFATIDHALALKAAGARDKARQQVAQVWPIFKAHARPVEIRLLCSEGLAPADTHP